MLVTDVGLPGLNGRKLAQEARRARPDLPVLLITGYAGSALDDMELAPGMEVMHKPFSLGEMADRVRGMMEVPVATKVR
jgi:DNA-binding response OmpR family regulator